MGDIRWIEGKLVDPPAGWQYGFPKAFNPRYPGQPLTEWLAKQGVPKEIIDLGHVRIIGE